MVFVGFPYIQIAKKQICFNTSLKASNSKHVCLWKLRASRLGSQKGQIIVCNQKTIGWFSRATGWCSTPTWLLICSSFSREDGHPLFICSSLSIAQANKSCFGFQGRVGIPSSCLLGRNCTMKIAPIKLIRMKCSGSKPVQKNSWMFPKIGGKFPPKSSHLFIGFGTIIFTIHFGGFTPIFGNTQLDTWN